MYIRTNNKNNKNISINESIVFDKEGYVDTNNSSELLPKEKTLKDMVLMF